MRNRIVFAGILGDRSDAGAFGQIQFADRLSEIAERSGLYAQGILSQIDGIQVVHQNIVFIIFDRRVMFQLLFQLNGKVLLLDLTLDLGKFALVGPVGKNIVF